MDVSSGALVSVFNAVTSVTARSTMTAGVQQVVPLDYRTIVQYLSSTTSNQSP